MISVNEFTFSAGQLNSQLLTRPVEVFSILAITYFLVCFTLTQSARALESRIARRRKGSGANPALTQIPQPEPMP